VGRIDWTQDDVSYAAVEASLDDVRVHAAALARAYNDPRNAALMGHDEPQTPDDVVEHYAELLAEGARAFLLFRDNALDGDGDLRGFHDGAAEFAFMIGAPDAQGKGLGTRYAIMIHAWGFARGGLATIYASIVPHNVASRRVFEKLGYWIDDSATARAYADDPGDIVMAIDRATFERVNAAALAQLAISS
jgi:RimJ/RimL family protein N-acetyltransferase